MIDLPEGSKGGIWAAIGAFILAIAVYFPKFMNMRKADSADGAILARIENAEKRMTAMDGKIHRQQVQITRFEVAVLHLVALLRTNGVEIPKYLHDEITELTKSAVEAAKDGAL